MRLRTSALRFVAVFWLALSFGVALADADSFCARALENKDPTDRLESIESHYSHRSVWEVRREFFKSDRARWREYLWVRYRPFLSRYTQYPLELKKFLERIKSAGAGVSGSLGELQIAEKYLLDPNVGRVQWIEESKVPGVLSPDFKIYYRDGGAKIVEVKTRSPEELPDAESFAAHLTKANLQVRDYKNAHPEARFLRAELEVVFSYTHATELTEWQKDQMAELADSFFKQTQWLTRMTLNSNNQPFFRVNLRWKNGERATRAAYLRRPTPSSR